MARVRQTRNREFAAREPLSRGMKSRDDRGRNRHAFHLDRIIRIAPGPHPRLAAFDGKRAADRDAMRHLEARAPELADLGGDVRHVVELGGAVKAGLGADQWNPEEFDHTYKTNVYPLFWLTRAALKQLRPGGSILATASVQAFQPSGQLLAYSSTKGAIATFIKALGELAIQHGVRANAVAPGPVWTPLIPSTMPQEKVKNFGGSTTIGRPAQPAELAGAYVFLASNDARYITSSVVDVTGGSMLT